LPSTTEPAAQWRRVHEPARRHPAARYAHTQAPRTSVELGTSPALEDALPLTKKKGYTYTRTPGKRTHVQTYINTYYPYTHIHTYICTRQTQQTENQLYHQLRAVLQSPDYCLSNGQERIRIGINICKGERRHFARTSEIQGAQVVGEKWGFLLTSITYPIQFYARALVSETERG
jgi:hypothetical protein